MSPITWPIAKHTSVKHNASAIDTHQDRNNKIIMVCNMVFIIMIIMNTVGGEQRRRQHSRRDSTNGNSTNGNITNGNSPRAEQPPRADRQVPS
jgi:hypothetical protein